MRTRVCVDGFNLYYGALKGTPFKWLDPVNRRPLAIAYLPSVVSLATAGESPTDDAPR